MSSVELLLEQWGFPKNVLDVFKENDVDLQALQLLDDVQINMLILVIRPQANFKKALSNWKVSPEKSREILQREEVIDEIISKYGDAMEGLSSSLTSPTYEQSGRSPQHNVFPHHQAPHHDQCLRAPATVADTYYLLLTPTQYLIFWNSTGMVMREANNTRLCWCRYAQPKPLVVRLESRLARQISSAQDASYLHNPGSEPLTLATLGAVLADTAHRFPGRVAVRSVHEDLTLTYEQLLTQADALGCALRAQGLEKGDRVGLWTHNNTAWIIALIAAARAGLISVLINPVYEKNELSFCIKKTGMKSLLIGNKLANRDYNELLNQLIPELQSSTPGSVESSAFPTLKSVITSEKEMSPGLFTIDSLISDYSKCDTSKYGQKVKPEEGCIIHFTSGTTGEPKAALDSHAGVVNNTYFTGKRNTFHEGHHNICVQVPLFHALGSVVTILGGLRHGASLVLASPTYNVSANVNALIGEKCTAIIGTPTMFVDMLSAIRSKGEIASTTRLALAAGAPCSPQLIHDIKKYLKADAVSGLYGMTETTASIFQSLPDDSIEKVAETVGYIQDHVEVKVVDDDGNQVPFGSSGELVSRGYNNMIGYWDDPEKTKQTIDKDGWLKTGDKFTIGKDGYGRIVGRLKDIIVRGGENIAPKEIEDILNTHPDIIESQVIGVSDSRLGEELCAVLRVRKGATVGSRDVEHHLAGRLAKFKIPRMVKHTNEFPKTASGKIQKFRLKEIVEAGKL